MINTLNDIANIKAVVEYPTMIRIQTFQN